MFSLAFFHACNAPRTGGTLCYFSPKIIVTLRVKRGVCGLLRISKQHTHMSRARFLVHLAHAVTASLPRYRTELRTQLQVVCARASGEKGPRIGKRETRLPYEAFRESSATCLTSYRSRCWHASVRSVLGTFSTAVEPYRLY